jgi:NADH-quinone oxidoreductase subunit E
MEIPTETKNLIQQRIGEIRQHYPEAQAACLPALYVCQDHLNHVSKDVLDLVAETLELPVAYVQGVATFYTMYNQKAVGRYHLQLCTNVSCLLNGAEELLAGLEEHLGIKSGQTTEDRLFSLNEVECLAACGTAPVLQVNDKYYEEMDLDAAKKLLDELKAKAGSDSRGEGEPRPNAEVPEA